MNKSSAITPPKINQAAGITYFYFLCQKDGLTLIKFLPLSLEIFDLEILYPACCRCLTASRRLAKSELLFAGKYFCVSSCFFCSNVSRAASRLLLLALVGDS